MMDQNPHAAFEELHKIVGPEGLDVTEPTRERYARSTSLSPSRPIGVAYPTNNEQVQAIVCVAAHRGLALHPISRGRNWGYGDATAPTDGQLIVDLSRMNQILEVNDKLAYAVIEPGVTQGQLFDYLKGRGIQLWLDCTGAGRDASLIGNALQRGFGHTPYSDHFANLCGMQVVLPDGQVLETGLSLDAGSRARYLYPYGLGPSLDGLFAQSDLGIVTRAAIWLMPQPEAFSAFFVRTRNDEDLEPIIDRLAALRLRGVIRSAVHIGNDLRVISSRIQYPWTRANHQTPLPQSLRAQLRSELGIGRWNVAGGIYGDAPTVRAAKRSLRNAMRPFGVMLVGDRKMALAHRFCRLLRPLPLGQRLRRLIAAMEPTYRLMKGEPVDEPLHSAAWRARGEIGARPCDPRDIHAGLMWISPVLPATGCAAREVVNIIEPICTRHRFEPLLSFTFVNDRALACICQISFDIREESESEQARLCHTELGKELKAAGFVPYRTRPQDRASYIDHSGVYGQVFTRIKEALDPHHIISPGA
jgi:4-cresol dehydrogenase (hydroxylating) flavoprotein subunit